MAGNAHRNRHHRLGRPCAEGCRYCKARPSVGDYANKNGHRRNPARGKRQRKAKIKIAI